MEGWGRVVHSIVVQKAGARTTWVQIPAELGTNTVTWGKLPNLSKLPSLLLDLGQRT